MMDVWVVNVSHRHGVNIYVAATEELAWDELYQYVKDNWEYELGGTSMPEGRDDAIGMYFERVEEEFYDLDRFPVKKQVE